MKKIRNEKEIVIEFNGTLLQNLHYYQEILTIKYWCPSIIKCACIHHLYMLHIVNVLTKSIVKVLVFSRDNGSDK